MIAKDFGNVKDFRSQSVTTGTKRRRAWDITGLGIAVWLQARVIT